VKAQTRDVAIKFLISTDDFSICRANKISGITAFVGCEPYYKYQTTGSMFQIHEVGTNPIFGDYNATFSFYINKAIAWGRRKGIDFNGVIYSTQIRGDDLLIRF
jgi:hypothetical protein